MSITTTLSSGSSTIHTINNTSGRSRPAINKRILDRQVVYPIFEECAEYTNDEFWRQKLILAARDRFPRNFGYRDGFLTYKCANKKVSVKLPDHDPVETLRLFLGFMNDRGVLSDIDTQNYKDIIEFNNLTDDSTPPETWTKVPISIRDKYIENYVTKVTEGMSKSATKSLRRVVYIGIKLKIFNKARIHMGHYCIEHIDSIVYDRDRDLFLIHPDAWRQARLTAKKSEVSHTPLNQYNKYFRLSLPNLDKTWRTKIELLRKTYQSSSSKTPTFIFGSNSSNPINEEESTNTVPVLSSERPTLTIV